MKRNKIRTNNNGHTEESEGITREQGIILIIRTSVTTKNTKNNIRTKQELIITT